MSYQWVTSTGFSELLFYLQFLKNNEPKRSNMPKRRILGWQNLLPCKRIGGKGKKVVVAREIAADRGNSMSKCPGVEDSTSL